MATELEFRNEGGAVKVGVRTGARLEVIGVVEGSLPLKGIFPADPRSRNIVRFNKSLDLLPMTVRALMGLRADHPGAVSVELIREAQGRGKVKEWVTKGRAAAQGLQKGLAEIRRRVEMLRTALGVLRNLKKLEGPRGRAVRKAAKQIVDLVKQLRKDGRITRGSAPDVKAVGQALLRALLGQDGRNERLERLVEKALGGKREAGFQDAVDKINGIVATVVEDTGGDGSLRDLAREIHGKLKLPATARSPLRGVRIHSEKDIFEFLRKGLRGASLDRFLEGMDKALEDLAGKLKEAEEAAQAVADIFDLAATGRTDRVKHKMQTYKKMKLLILGIQKLGMIDKLPPGARELANWPLEVFKGIEKGVEIVAKYAVEIERLVPNIRKMGDARADCLGKDRDALRSSDGSFGSAEAQHQPRRGSR